MLRWERSVINIRWTPSISTWQNTRNQQKPCSTSAYIYTEPEAQYLKKTFTWHCIYASKNTYNASEYRSQAKTPALELKIPRLRILTRSFATPHARLGCAYMMVKIPRRLSHLAVRHTSVIVNDYRSSLERFYRESICRSDICIFRAVLDSDVTTKC
jgi:hypothetical protein